MKRTASVKKASRSNASFRKPTRNRSRKPRLLVCLRNDGYEVDLQVGKAYLSLPDREGEKDGFVRVIDESGEDYLYPAEAFLPISLSPVVEKALLLAS